MDANEITRGPFVLDDRTLQWHLQRWLEEATNQGGDSEVIWKDFWFPVAFDLLNPELLQVGLETLLKAPQGNLPPQLAFLLAFLRQLETPQALLNTVAERHRDLYYRKMLGLSERAPVADHVVVGVELVSGIKERLIAAGTLLDGGQDAQQNPQQYALDSNVVANGGHFSDLGWTLPSARSDAPSEVIFSEADGIDWPEGGVRLFETQPAAANLSASAVDVRKRAGRIIASPALALNRGQRTLKLTFATQPAHPDRLLAWFSGAGQWQALSVDWADNRLILSVDALAPAIEAAPGLDGWSYSVPMLKLLHPDGLAVPAVTHLTLEVVAARDVHMATDAGRAAINQQVHPFGYEPLCGNAFYLSSSDWLKPTGSVSVTLIPQWLGLPEESFAQWYARYKNLGETTLAPKLATSDFQLKASILGMQTPVQPATQPLFADSGKRNSAPVARPLTFEFACQSRGQTDSDDPREGQSLCLELAGQDFRHAEYRQQLSLASLEGETLKPPCTALLQRLQVNYQYNAELNGEQDVQQVLTPFGYTAVPLPNAGSELFIGWTGVLPGQELSLYWNVRSPQSQAVNWFYMTGDNTWSSLDALVKDDTQGLAQSGLWRTRLPEDAWLKVDAEGSNGRHWIRGTWASAKHAEAEEPADTPWIYGLLSNAVLATRVSGLDAVLPAETIAHAVESLEGVQGFIQPWPSKGGLPAEEAPAFMNRVARRLAHRGRIVTRADISELLLERFKELHEVRIADTVQPVPARNEEQARLQLVVIPALGEQDNSDPLRPKLSSARLSQMKDYVRSLASPWLLFSLENPEYIPVQMYYKLIFIDGMSEDYGYQQVVDTLAKRFMPWGTTGGEGAVAVGVNLDYYEVLTALLQMPWVKSVDNLLLNYAEASIVAAPSEVLILVRVLDSKPPEDPEDTVSPKRNLRTTP